MTAPIRPDQFVVQPAPRKAGERSVGLRLRLHVRDELLRSARRRFLATTTDREAARLLHQAVGRFAAGAWRRERAEIAMPTRHRGRLEGLLWLILTTTGRALSEGAIRRAIRPYS